MGLPQIYKTYDPRHLHTTHCEDTASQSDNAKNSHREYVLQRCGSYDSGFLASQRTRAACAVFLSLLGLLADDGLQRLSGLECGYYLGGNLDLLPRLWIHPRRCLARSSLKLAEPCDDNGLILRECLGYEINHSLDRLAGIFFGKPRFLGQLFDELCFVHAVPPRVDSNGQHSI